MARGGEYVAHVQPWNEQHESRSTMAMDSLFVINLVIQCYALSIDYEIDVFSTLITKRHQKNSESIAE